MGNGNLVVAWQVYRDDLPMQGMSYPTHYFARVIDPQTGTFVTDEFRLFTDYYSVNNVSIEAVGDDGFYINAQTHNGDHIYSDVSLVVDNPLTITSNAPPVNTTHVGLISSSNGMAMGTELSTLGYRSPDNPDNFMQIAQTFLDKTSNGLSAVRNWVTAI